MRLSSPWPNVHRRPSPGPRDHVERRPYQRLVNTKTIGRPVLERVGRRVRHRRGPLSPRLRTPQAARRARALMKRLRLQMGVAAEHFPILVTRDKGNLFDGETRLEETARTFMPEIVKV